jgi:succinate dehydrogenase/fumarate reductase cytochrome b subunit
MLLNIIVIWLLFNALIGVWLIPVNAGVAQR